MMDTELFDLAVEAALRIPTSGIGTLSEKKVHAALKYYIQPDSEKHEVKVSGSVCDALSDDGVFEIQTRAFYRLKGKLEKLLKTGTVTVVYPIVSEKTLYTTNVVTGKVTVRKSPKQMKPYDVFSELYAIRSFILSENFRLRLITVGVEEHRVVKVQVSKRGRRKVETLSSEKVPTALYGDTTLSSPKDYASFLPSGLNEQFTSADLAALSNIHRSFASLMLHVLTDINVVERIGKTGNSYLYKLL